MGWSTRAAHATSASAIGFPIPLLALAPPTGKFAAAVPAGYVRPRAGRGVAVALHRSTMWWEGAVEEADYDDNIREHIVTASATVCWAMARFCLLRTKKTDDAQAKARLIRHANLWSTAAMAKEDAKP